MSLDYDTQINNVLIFNSTRTYTLAILDGLNNIKHFVRNEDGTASEKVVPITFANYEKFAALGDIDQATLEQGNWNFVPRMALSFDGMSKAAERTTNKFQKLSKKIEYQGKTLLNYGFNSVPYDFQFTLTLQARGLNEAFQIVEQILPRFRPSYNIQIREYPLFDEMTETQLQIEDPAFEILEEFSAEDVNIINVTFGLNLRANLYMPLQLIGAVETVKLFNHLWETQDYKEAQLASYYKWNVCADGDHKIYNTEIEEHYAPPKIRTSPNLPVAGYDETKTCTKN